MWMSLVVPLRIFAPYIPQQVLPTFYDYHSLLIDQVSQIKFIIIFYFVHLIKICNQCMITWSGEPIAKIRVNGTPEANVIRIIYSHLVQGDDRKL
jgi:hypothetical protein